jgi:hypothetical protein
MRSCGKCKRPHPNHWAVPFTMGVATHIHGLREAYKTGTVCSWCFRDYKGRRRPLEDEVVAGRLLHSLVVMPGVKGA